MLAHRLRRWFNIKPTLYPHLVLVGLSPLEFGRHVGSFIVCGGSGGKSAREAILGEQ